MDKEYNPLAQSVKQWNEEEDFTKWEEYYKKETYYGKTYYGERSRARQRKILQYLDDLKLRKRANVLELGYGAGMIAAEVYRRGFNITGVDISYKFREIAMRNCGRFKTRKNKAKFDFTIGNAEKLNFPDNKFDCVIGSGFLQYTGNPVSCLKEVYRVLKPGGYLIIGQRNMYGIGYLDGPLQLIKPLIYITTKRKYEIKWQDTILREPVLLFAFLMSPFSDSMRRVRKELILRKKTGLVRKIAMSFYRLESMIKQAHLKVIRYDGAGYLTKKGWLFPQLAKKLDNYLQEANDHRRLSFIYKYGNNIIFLAQKDK